ncbi:hypothetical protein I7I50_08022 [Histoplasma capsulatum G186AR]|uniref:Uncharacterized protein n=1 Tax=Ajellomyces capsulatus TaxID=5037 RepID=A0A8H7YHJ3_AJECA|nr:hypothetical protein I7I52_08538 [Histoplasma capsulatum]QSS68569.1 hypothetical protein I7I50_08022 [Histoplasma capsulatum G186AR]
MLVRPGKNRKGNEEEKAKREAFFVGVFCFMILFFLLSFSLSFLLACFLPFFLSTESFYTNNADPGQTSTGFLCR